MSTLRQLGQDLIPKVYITQIGEGNVMVGGGEGGGDVQREDRISTDLLI